jgi:hypothetical protein
MTSAMSRALALHTIGVALTATHKMLDDAKFTAWSDTWQNATAIYTILQRLALVSPTLALGLQPVQAFFKTKKTKGGREGDRDEGGSGSGSRVTEGMRAAQGFLTGRIPVEQRGIEHEPPSAPIVDDRRVKDATEATRDDARRPEVSASAYPGADAVEAALAEAIRGAASAGEWATVAALARELEARRVARAGNVVTLSGRTKHRP